MEWLFGIVVICGVLLLCLWVAKRGKARRRARKSSPKSADVAGLRGEYEVSRVLGKTRKGKRYVLYDYLLQSGQSSSQIDHIVIQENGVFVIETKNYAGLILGNADSQNWTQVLDHGRIQNTFYNPVKQNETHVSRLKLLLPKGIPVFSLVVFVQNNVDGIDAAQVIPLSRLSEALAERRGVTLSKEEMADLYDRLCAQARQCTLTEAEHVKNIQENKSRIERGICPRCGGKLVERTGPYGAFYGCERYPDCTFVYREK